MSILFGVELHLLFINFTYLQHLCNLLVYYFRHVIHVARADKKYKNINVCYQSYEYKVFWKSMPYCPQFTIIYPYLHF